MLVYRVIGIYEQTKFLQRFIPAEGPDHAVEKFIAAVQKNHPLEWERMGVENVFVKLAPQGS